MDTNDYQVAAARTLIDKPDFVLTNSELMTIWNAIGLAGEAGEVCELVKKGIFHQHGLDREKIFKELGDLCWYLASLCTNLDIELGDVMAGNIAKLLTRYPNGFSSADSMARRDINST